MTFILEIQIKYKFILLKLKQLKIFLTKIRPTVPLIEVPLVRPNDLAKGGGVPPYPKYFFFSPKVLAYPPLLPGDTCKTYAHNWNMYGINDGA